ncbi:MAG: UDP-N-acetylglucosamine 2-epimerase (non-hydrolyzing) [Kiritimatiellae bacterium]|nr:UDP-N-acetylglucosamine 2-epimerase (non-hydrolyzing) [Kiritimatiellia bacterium]
MKIVSVVGARPNFMKVAPFCRALKAYPDVRHVLVHTGQHYDVRMSEQFFRELDIPSPDINLEIGSGTHAEQVGRTMIAFEKVLRDERPDWVVVLGDVNATCACSITAKKEHVRCAHIEAGLRSRDMDMPEEINRLVTDRLSDLLFTPDRMSDANLRAEGVPEDRIRFVGNIMIDTLERERSKAESLDLDAIVRDNAIDGQARRTEPHLADNGYVAMTMHRPSNVDSRETLVPAMRFFLDEVSREWPIVWAIHPRARKMLMEFGLWDEVAANPNLVLVNPLGYHAMLRLNMGARLFMTDSGGLQEECCVLGTPCLTMRWNTERPVTLMENGGASILVGNAVDRMREAYRSQIDAERRAMRPELWDGHTAERIAGILARSGD